MEHCRRTKLQTEQGCGRKDGDHAKADPLVLANDPAGGPAQIDGKGQPPQVIALQRNVSSFQRHIQSRSFHRNLDRGVRYGGSIVHSVIRYGDRVFRQQPLYLCDLVFGHPFTHGVLNVNGPRNGIDDTLYVAGDHDLSAISTRKTVWRD